MNKFTTLATGLTLALASVGAFAQGGFTSTPRIDQREANQQARIEQGVASGEINRREARRLERQQARIRAAEWQAKRDGVVTRYERRYIERLQREASANIRAEKHDRQVSRHY